MGYILIQNKNESASVVQKLWDIASWVAYPKQRVTSRHHVAEYAEKLGGRVGRSGMAPLPLHLLMETY